MIDIKLKYQASIFLNASDIGPSPENITTLVALFKDIGFMPSTFQEIGGSAQMPIRLGLSTASNEWTIRFASHQINIEKHPTEPMVHH